MSAVAGIISAVAGSSGSDDSGQKSGVDGLLSGGPATSLFTSIINQAATKDAMEALTKALDNAEEKITAGYDEATGIYQPIYERGMQDYNTLDDAVREGEFDVTPGTFQAENYNAPQYTSEYQAAQYQNPNFNFNFEADPGYQFRKQEGMGAIEGSAAARGSQLSGATMKALSKYGQNLASEEYQNAYNRARGAFESDRGFGRGVYESDRGFGYNRFLNDRDFSRGTYESDRNFGYGAFSDDYNRRRSSSLDRYGRMSDMANVGLGTAGTMADLSISRAADLANLEIQRGNVNAGYEQASGQNYGDIATGGTSMGFGAGQMVANNLNTSNQGQSGQQPLGSGATRTTAYPNGVPNTTIYDTDMNTNTSSDTGMAYNQYTPNQWDMYGQNDYYNA